MEKTKSARMKKHFGVIEPHHEKTSQEKREGLGGAKGQVLGAITKTLKKKRSPRASLAGDHGRPIATKKKKTEGRRGGEEPGE